MVNVGFPQATLYGFEMVDAVYWRRTAVNRKFTPNQLIRVFREFSAI
jgi:hypothetical protein